MAAPPKREPPRGGTRSGGKSQTSEHRINSATGNVGQQVSIDWSAHFISVHDGRLCLGHLLKTRRGWRAIDADNCDLGEAPGREAAREILMASLGRSQA